VAALSERDLRLVLDFVGEAYDAQDLDEFRSVLLPGIHRFVPSDYVTYNEVEQSRQAGLTLASPELPDWAHLAWGRHAGENPLLQRFLRTRDGRSRRFSDVVSRGELRRTPLYTELYGPLGIPHQVAFVLPSTPELTIGIALSRGGRDYTERDRRLLELSRPHLIQAYRAAQLRERLVGILTGLQQGLEADGTAIVVIDASGEVSFVSTAAAELFEDLRGATPIEVGRPPGEPLSSWLADGGSTTSLPIAEESDAMLARCVRGDGGTRVLLLERAGRALSLEALGQLGLTPREAEVLHGLARGEDPETVATELQVSPRTVAKHVQHIHAKLGVSTRAQAVATAWAAASGTLLGVSQYPS
jgi:DNA-binding CsgD family transcriptional regulator/PAS domain-containing protein